MASSICFSRTLAALLACVLASRIDAVLVAADSFLQGPAAGRPLGQYATGDMRTSGTTLLGFASPGQYASAPTSPTSNFQIEGTVGAFQNSAAVTYDTDVTAGGTQRQIAWGGTGTVASRDASREFNSTAVNTNSPSGEWWMSIMLNRTGWLSTQNSFVVGGFANANDSNNGVAFGYGDASGDGIPELVMRSNYQTLTTLPTSAGGAPANTLQFVIAKLNINTAGLDTITVWVNPSNVSSEAALGSPVIAPITTHEVSNNANNPFTRARFFSPGITGPVKFDELRLATDLASLTGVMSAIPEPSSFLTFGLIGSAVAALRSARRR